MTDAELIERLERIERMTLLASKNVLDINDVSSLTGYTVKYLRLLIANREIPHYRRGNRLFFNRDEIEEWMMDVRIPTKDEINIQAVGYTATKHLK